MNDAKYVDDIARLLLRQHLLCSNSLDGKPSAHHYRIDTSSVAIARAMDEFDLDDPAKVTRRQFEDAEWAIKPLIAEACAIADDKWAAAVTLLLGGGGR